MPEQVDVVVVGAGLSGIAQAWHLRRRCPDLSVMILEARAAIGGTWDLFRYPGVRSDSDMHTLGFSFRPWRGRAIAEGAAIRDYLADTARATGLDRLVRFGRRVTAAEWSSAAARWTLSVEGPAGTERIGCGFLCLCAGYYDYAGGHAPAFPDAERFAGPVIHPQHWPAGVDLAGQRVVVIGSGATAVSLVPALARTAAHVTMLQRSPSYVVAAPGDDALHHRLARWLGERAAHRLTRWKNIALGMAFFQLARRRPAATSRRLIGEVRRELGPGYDVATHFTPSYQPWDQRLCLVPDADLFAALRAGTAEVVTDRIERFTPAGIALASGRELACDAIVTATGLELRLAGGVALTVDGAAVDLAGRLQYKGMMFEGVPNLAYVFGYTNASWTLKAELVARYVCRLLRLMRRRGLAEARPVNADAGMATLPFVEFSSGYIRRAAARLPRQGERRPWRLRQNYAADLVALRFGPLGDAMRFTRARDRDREAA